jgi:hypothetical protein
VTIRVQVQVGGIATVRALARRFERAADGGLQGRLVQALSQEAPSALTDTRAAWMGVEVDSSKGGGSSSGLRARTAAATATAATPRGVTFTVNGTAIDPAYGRGLAWYLDGYGRWRHPVFGRTANPQDWQQQTGQEVFFKTLRGHKPGFEGRLERVVDEVTREIEG